MEQASAAAPALTPADAARLMRLASYASVCVAATLIAVKLVAWFISDSVSVLSTLVDSLLDVGASIVTLLAVREAVRPADDDHRFGHGKAEALSGLAQSAFIVGSAVWLVVESISRLVEPVPVAEHRFAIGSVVLSIALTLLLLAFQRSVVKRTGSTAIAADSLHYSTDLLVNLAVIAALVASTTGGLLWFDPVAGLCIAAVIVTGALKIARGAVNMLMDRELPPETIRRVEAIALAHPEVRAIHDVRTRASGRDVFIQFHMELDGAMPLMQAHLISEAVEAEIRAAIPGAEILIHEDPFESEAGMPRRKLA